MLTPNKMGCRAPDAVFSMVMGSSFKTAPRTSGDSLAVCCRAARRARCASIAWPHAGSPRRRDIRVQCRATWRRVSTTWARPHRFHCKVAVLRRHDTQRRLQCGLRRLLRRLHEAVEREHKTNKKNRMGIEAVQQAHQQLGEGE